MLEPGTLGVAARVARDEALRDGVLEGRAKDGVRILDDAPRQAAG